MVLVYIKCNENNNGNGKGIAIVIAMEVKVCIFLKLLYSIFLLWKYMCEKSLGLEFRFSFVFFSQNIIWGAMM